MNCFGCNNPSCKRIEHNYDTVVIKVPLFNGTSILIKGILNVYDHTVSVNYNDIEYCFVTNNKDYLKYRLRNIPEKNRRRTFLYSGIAKVECCNEGSIQTINSIYLRLFIRASAFYSRKSRTMEHITILKKSKPVMTYEERMEKWYNDMDAVRSMILDRV